MPSPTPSAVAISRRVRAMHPWPAAYTLCSGKRLIVSESVVSARAEDTCPGRIQSLSPLLVGTGEGLLEIVRLKAEGKKEMDAGAFLAGHPVRVGDTLG